MKVFHPLAKRILAGEKVTFCEIAAYNAQTLIKRGEHEYAERQLAHEFCCPKEAS